ncbi:heavy metal translocating P-type ATPase, partial [Streptomyces sp. SID11233]|nr:heavy metal translocating P-type ATPase [Streptomyces sp. SID11233]
EGTGVDDLIATVVRTGYTAEPILPPEPEPEPEPAPEAEAGPTADQAPQERSPADARLADLRHRLLVSVVLALPVVVLAMVPPLQFDNWQWL